MSPVPPLLVTIVGGYLGSGKTTRLNELLASWEGDPVAVVVNDFGSVNIDASLIRSRDGDLLELENGCVCCDLSEGMASVLDQLRARDPRPAHVVIEVSGVGDPAGVAPWARHPGFALNGTLVCVDAETVRRRATDRWVADTVLAQLRSADVLLPTKVDLVEERQRVEVEGWLRDVAPGTPLATDRGALAALLSSGAALESAVPATSAFPGAHAVDAHRSCSASTSEPVDLDRVRAFLEGLPAGVVRAKGVLRTRQAPTRRTVVQLVGRRLEVREDGDADPAAPSTLVLIATAEPSVPGDLEHALAEAVGPPVTP
ncbi:Putative metal chaperone YciC [Nocardioides dokdonensis FR1436]|uniref:Putative metal chaperone YciC n=1 Tax=Nocardioides dokdonensis FR1436 TaxID=1300347 RepID=A0A1A9GHK9_9ACTN|nr:GTP-binding protein [Nocardioides dokdonensis]ANH37093.1 Putative metal chaperone YciC [Nocardioides dokdonensis FR1436]